MQKGHWVNEVFIGDILKDLENKFIDVREAADKMIDVLEGVSVTGFERLEEEKESLIEEFTTLTEDFKEDEWISRFEDLLDAMYDWGDTSIGGSTRICLFDWGWERPNREE